MLETTYDRPILYPPVDKSGLFVMPKTFGPKDEIEWDKRRMDTVRISQYADDLQGLPHTLDKAGAYLCGGRANGSSSACNKFVKPSSECLIRIKLVAEPTKSSCAMWETKDAGDPETRYCPHGKMEDERIGFGTTKNPLGFGCERCEYGQGMLYRMDSAGRGRWCSLKGHSVGNKSCCWDNEPEEDNDSKREEKAEQSANPLIVLRRREAAIA